ncbi:MAG TPA: DNA polymerase I [Candidatus Limnocylindrales bacterium]|nr:DNA polymerase I [Candidatus Limnocylindrales bacterium]
MPTERLMLLDGYGLVYRGYFALPPLTTSRGELVNGAFGFASIVLRGLQDLKPDYLAVSFDLPGPTFRHEQYADYKATRTKMPDDLRDQFPKVREIVKALRIPVYEMQGYEADDVIGTITTQLDARDDLETTIVTVDLDMLQLVTPRVRLMTTRSGVENTVMYDVEKIDERFGLRPDQMVDYKSLKGDPTDNIPGVPGVGEKTAAKLIRDFGDLDTLLARLDEVTPPKLGEKLREHRDQILMGRELSRIVRDLPIQIDLEAARLGDYDRDTVVRLFREYEFRTLIERLPPMAGESAEQRSEALRSVAESGYVPAARVAGRPDGWGASRQGVRPESGELQLRLDFASVAGGAAPGAGASGAMAAASNGHEPRGMDPDAVQDLPTALAAAIVDPGRIELRGLDRIAELEDWIRAQPAIGVSLVADDPRPRRGTPLALAVAGSDGRVIAADGADASTALRHLIEQTGIPLVGHEVKPILVAAIADDPDRAAIPVAFDTQIAAYILNAALRSQTIADIVAENLDQILPAATELPATARAGIEALSAIAVREPLERRLVEVSLDRLFRDIELPLIPVLARMEAVGVALDREALSVLDLEFRSEIERLEREIYIDVGHEFNLGSPKQLEQVLFFELNLPKGRRTKTGYSTDASVLEDLRPAHPMVDKLLEWRVYTKLRSTYVEALPNLIAEADGRLHTTFHQAVAATGRLSSSDPNLQNIPIRTTLGRRIRRAFVAGAADLTLLAADYSQIELRILAHVSGDEHLKDAFARNADIHRETAARVLHKDPDSITHGERSMAKMVNFGLAYGMSDFGLASRANIPRKEAQEFISSYFAAYSGISYYMMAIKEQAKSQGFVETLLGRKRQIPELRASNPALRGSGERMAINMPIQGTAADIVKIAMIRLAERLSAEGFRARMLLQVHDELLLEVPRDELDALVPIVRAEMEGAVKLDIPLDVDLKAGEDWESLTPIPR